MPCGKGKMKGKKKQLSSRVPCEGDTDKIINLNIMPAQKLERQPCEVYSRVVGYLAPIHRWNPGKKQEFKDRKTFKPYAET